jgi:hypothetical protein
VASRWAFPGSFEVISAPVEHPVLGLSVAVSGGSGINLEFLIALPPADGHLGNSPSGKGARPPSPPECAGELSPPFGPEDPPDVDHPPTRCTPHLLYPRGTVGV